MPERAKRRSRTEMQEERLRLIDQRITRKRREIEELEAKRQELLNPPATMADVVSKIRESGIAPDEILRRLGLDD